MSKVPKVSKVGLNIVSCRECFQVGTDTMPMGDSTRAKKETNLLFVLRVGIEPTTLAVLTPRDNPYTIPTEEKI